MITKLIRVITVLFDWLIYRAILFSFINRFIADSPYKKMFFIECGGGLCASTRTQLFWLLWMIFQIVTLVIVIFFYKKYLSRNNLFLILFTLPVLLILMTAYSSLLDYGFLVSIIFF